MKQFLSLFVIPALLFCVSCSTKDTGSMKEPQSYEEMEAQRILQLAREDVQNARAQIIDETMELTDEQKKVFWPIYSEYEKEFEKIGDERISILMDYADNIDAMTDKKAKELADRSIKARMDRVNLMKKYHEKMSKALGPVTAARFLQVENMINLIVDIQIASEVPLMGDSPQ